MSRSTEAETESNDLKTRLEALGPLASTLLDRLVAANPGDEEDIALDWATSLGDNSFRSGESVQVSVELTAQAGAALDLADAGNPEHTFAAKLPAAAAQGYVRAATARPPETETNAELRDRVAELTALHRINSSANSSLKLTEILSETGQAVVEVTHADTCSIFLYEPEWDELVLTATSGLRPDAVGQVRLRIGEGITGWAALVGKPVTVRDAWSDPRFKYVGALGEEEAASILAVPVVLFTKEKLVGVITVHTFQERGFSDNEVKFLETVAGELAIAIENARLYEQTDSRLQQKVAELSTLQGVSAQIAATLDLSEVLTLIAYQAAHLVRADAAVIYELNPAAGTLELVAQYDLQLPYHDVLHKMAAPNLTVPIQVSEIAKVITRGIPAALPPESDAALKLPFASGEYRSLFCVPLVAPRAIMGGICLYNVGEKHFSSEQISLLDAFAREAAIALENSRLYDAALRGLQTKSAMLQEMNHRVRNNLQTVAGLLSMQLRRMPPSSGAETAVRESIARIQSMAAVHDLMVRGDLEVQTTSLHELIRKVSEAAVSTLKSPQFELKLEIGQVEPDQIRIGSQDATLVALLINELVSNTILHGFEGRQEGSLTISARHAESGVSAEPANTFASDASQNRVFIEVSDDGKGLPKGFDTEKSANLGLNIVRTLVVKDLRGEFSIETGPSGKGTRATISFVSRPTGSPV